MTRLSTNKIKSIEALINGVDTDGDGVISLGLYMFSASCFNLNTIQPKLQIQYGMLSRKYVIKCVFGYQFKIHF